MDEDDLEDVTGYLRTSIDCPECNEPFDVEGDATGGVVTCPEGHRMHVGQVL